MAAGWIFFTENGEEVALDLDVILSETPTGEAVVTDHPVEDGADVSDNIRARPMGLSIEAVVTNSPLDAAPAKLRYNAAARPPRMEFSETFSTENRTAWVDQSMERVRQAGLLCRVVTKRREYTDMALTSYSPPADKATGDALRFSASFRKVVKVSTRTVAVAVKKPKPVPTAKKVAGDQPTKAASGPVEKRVSLARQAWRFAGGR